MNATAAKHSENRLKFCGHKDGISPGVLTFFTASSCEEVKPWVTRAIMSFAEGVPVLFVPSAHTREREPSNWLERLWIGVGVPIPY